MSDAVPSRITVDLAAYGRNLDVVRGLIPPECSILAVVKANAYGLGVVPIARRALEHGVSMLGVAHIHEGIELREAGIEAPILVLVQPSLSDLILAIRYKLRVMVSDYRTAERLGDLARKNKYVAPIHCEVDTGMGRQGFGAENIARELLELSHISNVDIEGIATHFASSDEPNDPYMEQQFRAFQKILKQASRDGIPFEIAHAANSGAVLNHGGTACDMVRVGIMSYGVWPNNIVREAGKLHHVVRWTSSVVLVKQLAGGASVSYGRTWRASSPTRIGVVPVGYADGYRRALSNNSDVLIRGKRCPIRGAITMNEILVDLNGIPEANVGDRVTLIGEDQGERMTVEELAEKAGTIGYEILTGLGSGIPRDYLN